MSKTIKYTGLFECSWRCEGCARKGSGRNSAGVAARHHYATEHTVHVETYSGLTMCKEDSEYHTKQKARNENT